MSSAAYFTVALPRSNIKDRGWRQSYLGPVREDPYALRNCAKLALLKGYDHFIRHEDMCYSSHAMPANLYKLDDKDYGKETKRDHREFVQPYFIKGMSKLSLPPVKLACEYSRLSFAPATTHVVAGANERRLYSQATVKLVLFRNCRHASRCVTF